ncbi:UPF0481 protein At3g47200-like [Miscanthus floridulus]|uniref:UPF0481 protein At3g47200-like n=1 Tax=Miscanthus floridulus TaxID=154761 RepID=UPI00345969FF
MVISPSSSCRGKRLQLPSPPKAVSEQQDYYNNQTASEEGSEDSGRPEHEASPRLQLPRRSHQPVDYYTAHVVTEKPMERWDSALVSRQIQEFDGDFGNMERKMHTFPLALSRFRQRYGDPVLMPIGPYAGVTLDLDTLNTVKNVATHHFRSGTIFGSVDDMFKHFCSAVGDVRRLCQRTDDFLVAYRNKAKDDDSSLKFNMLLDGCFLLEYMQMRTNSRDDGSMPKLLACYLDSNKAAIDRDMMLLENQLPWVVIQTLARYQQQEVTMKEFVAKMARTLQVRRGPDDSRLPGSEPPHLLGLLRSYKIGYGSHGSVVVPPSDGSGTIRPMSKTTSAIELAEIGIKLKASKTTRLIDMGIKKTLLGAELFVAPLLLDEIRLCWLINMAAFELCAAPTYAASSSTDVQGYAENRAVSAYLVVLAMLMDREEDVHALRSKGLLQGQLTNKEILDFFKDLVKSISGGPLYAHLMREIEDYKIKRWVWIKLYKFIYKNYRTIAALLSVVGVLAGIFKTLLSLKQH